MVLAGIHKLHENTQQSWVWFRQRFSNILALTVRLHLDVKVFTDIKLPPFGSIDCFDLHGYMATAFARSDDVVVGDITSKGRCQKTTAAQFCGYEELPNRTSQLGVLACRHAPDSTANAIV